MLGTQEEGMSLGTAQSISKSCGGQTMTQKALETLGRGLELEGGWWARPWSASCKVTAELDPGCFAKDHAGWREAL